eukprot:CAMPEP_0178468782 /NCGR_PEP_ID=MMETSP0689_2-20121128/53093_1 /TAXON_ID=160604 /ORGANISM="Amphidinium massartii, Strain CS-259" /LENGTH=99 /DNA_ID=CAMNT_0020095841 /DNA_START=144 /DNA_END=443 /DNA_ORIENTATION=+
MIPRIDEGLTEWVYQRQQSIITFQVGNHIGLKRKRFSDDPTLTIVFTLGHQLLAIKRFGAPLTHITSKEVVVVCIPCEHLDQVLEGAAITKRPFLAELR